MDYSIRELRQNESKVLNTFLYEAIFIPEGVPIPPKEIINQPELQVYVKDFGKNKGDLCLVAEANNQKKCLSPAKKYKLYKSSINKSIHFVQRSLSSSTRG